MTLAAYFPPQARKTPSFSCAAFPPGSPPTDHVEVLGLSDDQVREGGVGKQEEEDKVWAGETIQRARRNRRVGGGRLVMGCRTGPSLLVLFISCAEVLDGGGRPVAVWHANARRVRMRRWEAGQEQEPRTVSHAV